MDNLRLDRHAFNDPWVALSIGNTHWRWGYFEGLHLSQHWVMSPTALERPEITDWNWARYCAISPAFAWHHQLGRSPFPPLTIAGVVSRVVQGWKQYPHQRSLSLDAIPIKNLYPTLGLDRALAMWGAGSRYGWPILVIDAGTALTLSGVDPTLQFQGGAIAPGLGLQLATLASHTDALPKLTLPKSLPPRWSMNTQDAILSGVIFSTLDTICSFSTQWLLSFPLSKIILTGGDSHRLHQYLKDYLNPQSDLVLLKVLRCDETILLQGMAQVPPGNNS